LRQGNIVIDAVELMPENLPTGSLRTKTCRPTGGFQSVNSPLVLRPRIVRVTGATMISLRRSMTAIGENSSLVGGAAA
jgi:hypothetical protein